MKKIKVMICVLVLLALVGCGGENANDEAIKIGLLRIDDSTPFYVAQEEGLFADAGLNVELISFSSSSDQSVALEAGELDMAMNDMIVQCLMQKNGTTTKAVEIAYGAVPSEGRFLVVSAPDSRILTPQDLVGKKVAISTNTMMQYLFESFVEIYDLPAEEITVVNMPNLSLRLEAVLSGNDLDAALLPDPLAAFAVSQGCNVVIDDTALGVNLSQSVVLCTDEFLADNAELVTQVLACYDQAKDLLNNAPLKYRELALSTANVPAELAASYPAVHYTTGVLPSEEYVNDIVSWLESHELISEKYAYEDLVWNGSGK